MNTREFMVSVYLCLLKLFPKSYRAEYSNEIEFVIRQTLDRAVLQGRLPLLRMAWRERRDLPKAALRAHIKESKRRITESGAAGSPVDDPVVGWHLIIVFVPFLMALAIPSLNLAGRFVHLSDFEIVILLVGLLAVLMCLVIIAGFAKGLPRWSIPSAGLLICIIGYQIFTAWVEVTPPQFHLGSVSEEVFFTIGMGFIFYGHMLLLSVVLVLAAAWVRPLRPFYERVRWDWSLLSFMLYSGALVALLLMFGRYQGAELYQLAGFLILAVGAWVYLRLKQAKTRLSALLTAEAITMGLIGIGKYLLYPQQVWVVHSTYPRWWEALVPLIDGVTLLLVIAAPVVLKFFPASAGQVKGKPA
jgi:hypothetical protein